MILTNCSHKMSAIGIDLGTTYSCVAAFRNGKIEIIHNDQGSRVTPSCVSFTENESLIGQTAKEEIAFNFENTLFQIKRLIGRNFDDPSVQEDLKFWGFKLISDKNKPKIQVEYKGALKTFYPEEISAMILKELKEAAEAYMGTTYNDAVITVPAYFNDAQRKATRDAGTIAGLNVLSMINEPTAAAIAYGFDREENKKRNVLIYDLGGGTFDVTVATIRGQVFDVKATGGDTHLGGEDFDNNMVDYFTKEFNRLHNTDMSGNKRAMNRLRVQCEAAKRKLSVSMQAKVQADGLHGGIDFITTISRAKFEDMNSEYFEKTIETVKTTLAEANIDKNMIDDVVLVGGSTRIPKIREMLKKYFNGKELYKTINPDEAVAYGAAALASNLSKDKSAGIKELVLHDIMPLSLGMECGNDAMCVVVKRNTKIPSKHFKSVTTHHDNQTKIRFSVYQGERTSTKYNRLLGSFTLAGILPAPRHVPNIDVCFDIDSSGILTVTAKDEATGNENDIKLDSYNVKLSNEDIKKMIKEAEKFKLDDKDFKDRVQSRNKLEDLIRSTKQSVQDLVSKNQLSEEEQTSLLKTCGDSLEWMDRNKDVAKHVTDRKLYELERIFHPIFTKIYRGEKNTANEGSGAKQKTKNFSDQFMKQEHERETLDKARSDLKKYLTTMTGKANEKQFEKCTERTNMLEQCQLLKTWLNNNPNATMQEINKIRQEFSTYFDQLFPRMEHNVQAAEIKMREGQKKREVFRRLTDFISSTRQDLNSETYDSLSLRKIANVCNDADEWLKTNYEKIDAENIKSKLKELTNNVQHISNELERRRKIMEEKQKQEVQRKEEASNRMDDFISSTRRKLDSKNPDSLSVPYLHQMAKACNDAENWCRAYYQRHRAEDIETKLVLLKKNIQHACEELEQKRDIEKKMQWEKQLEEKEIDEEISKLSNHIASIRQSVRLGEYGNGQYRDKITKACFETEEWVRINQNHITVALIKNKSKEIQTIVDDTKLEMKSFGERKKQLKEKEIKEAISKLSNYIASTRQSVLGGFENAQYKEKIAKACFETEKWIRNSQHAEATLINKAYDNLQTFVNETKQKMMDLKKAHEDERLQRILAHNKLSKYIADSYASIEQRIGQDGMADDYTAEIKTECLTIYRWLQNNKGQIPSNVIKSEHEKLQKCVDLWKLQIDETEKACKTKDVNSRHQAYDDLSNYIEDVLKFVDSRKKGKQKEFDLKKITDICVETEETVKRKYHQLSAKQITSHLDELKTNVNDIWNSLQVKWKAEDKNRAKLELKRERCHEIQEYITSVHSLAVFGSLKTRITEQHKRDFISSVVEIQQILKTKDDMDGIEVKYKELKNKVNNIYNELEQIKNGETLKEKEEQEKKQQALQQFLNSIENVKSLVFFGSLKDRLTSRDRRRIKSTCEHWHQWLNNNSAVEKGCSPNSKNLSPESNLSSGRSRSNSSRYSQAKKEIGRAVEKGRSSRHKYVSPESIHLSSLSPCSHSSGYSPAKYEEVDKKEALETFALLEREKIHDPIYKDKIPNGDKNKIIEKFDKVKKQKRSKREAAKELQSFKRLCKDIFWKIDHDADPCNKDRSRRWYF